MFEHTDAILYYISGQTRFKLFFAPK